MIVAGVPPSFSLSKDGVSEPHGLSFVLFLMSKLRFQNIAQRLAEAF
jgi:hypothetical protein